MARAVDWVYRLMDRRLWYERPVCVGALLVVRRAYGMEEIGTEVILKRSGA